MDVAAQLGSKYFHFTLVPDFSFSADAPSYDEVLDNAIIGASRVAEQGAKHGITSIFEPQGMYFNGEGLTRFYDMINRLSVTVGICMDAANLCFVNCP